MYYFQWNGGFWLADTLWLAVTDQSITSCNFGNQIYRVTVALKNAMLGHYGGNQTGVSYVYISVHTVKLWYDIFLTMTLLSFISSEKLWTQWIQGSGQNCTGEVPFII